MLYARPLQGCGLAARRVWLQRTVDHVRDGSFDLKRGRTKHAGCTSPALRPVRNVEVLDRPGFKGGLSLSATAPALLTDELGIIGVRLFQITEKAGHFLRLSLCS